MRKLKTLVTLSVLSSLFFNSTISFAVPLTGADTDLSKYWHNDTFSLS